METVELAINITEVARDEGMALVARITGEDFISIVSAKSGATFGTMHTADAPEIDEVMKKMDKTEQEIREKALGDNTDYYEEPTKYEAEELIKFLRSKMPEIERERHEKEDKQWLNHLPVKNFSKNLTRCLKAIMPAFPSWGWWKLSTTRLGR